MNHIKGLAVFLIIIVIAVGCSGSPKPTEKYKMIFGTEVRSNYEAPTLPTNATNLTDIGNGWYTFQLEVGGKKRTFMVSRYKTHSYSVTSITELSN